MNSPSASGYNPAEKFVAIEGSVNLRDFGGYPTKGGQSVKRGLLFRCGSMHAIPQHAWDEFEALNIGVICDLRGEDEAAESPTPQSAPFACRVHIPIWPGSSTQFQQQTRTSPPSLDDFTAFMHRVTCEIARDHVHAYEKVMGHLLDTDNGFLIHCTAGKDRTGVGAALILSLLGVDRETIMHDYLISNESSDLLQRTRERMQQRMQEEGRNVQIDENILRVMAGVKADYLHGAFEEIETHYGGIDGYLEAAGIGPAEISAIRAKLLE